MEYMPACKWLGIGTDGYKSRSTHCYHNAYPRQNKPQTQCLIEHQASPWAMTSAPAIWIQALDCWQHLVSSCTMSQQLIGNKSQFCTDTNDHHVCERCHWGEMTNPASNVMRHTGITPDIKVWGSLLRQNHGTVLTKQYQSVLLLQAGCELKEVCIPLLQQLHWSPSSEGHLSPKLSSEVAWQLVQKNLRT